MKKDVSVELVRIIACLIVIGCHVYPEILVDGNCIVGRLFIACVAADGVAIFWLIMGFFLFNNSSYEKLIRKTIKHIVFPMVVFSTVAFYFGGWIAGNVSLQDSMTHSGEEYVNLVKSLCLWRNPVNGCGHLWYLYTYLLIILIFPVLKSFVQYLDDEVQREKIFLIISFAFLLLNDVTGNRMAQFSHESLGALIPASIEVVWGHILYRHREFFWGRRCALVSVLSFLIFNILRMLIQQYRYINMEGNEAILFWYSTIGLMCASCVVTFAFSVCKMGKKKRLDKIICGMASCTFTIYMIQYMSMDFLRRSGFKDCFSNVVYNILHGWMADSAYTIGYSLSVFLVSLVITLMIKIFRERLATVRCCIIGR